MAEDFHDKTEEPTPKKLADARKKGYVAKSNDLTIAMMSLGCMVFFFFFAPFMLLRLKLLMLSLLQNINVSFAQIDLMTFYVHRGLSELALIFLPLFFGITFMAILFNISQTGIVISAYPLKPKWKNINIFNPSNYERNFGLPAIAKMTFGLGRLNMVMILSWTIMGADALVIFGYCKASPQEIANYIYHKTLILGTAYSVAYLIIGIFDYFFQKWRFMRQMRMSRREVKDELKQMEGDQNIKSRIRSMMLRLTDESRVGDVPQADVVVSNGSKYVVAIVYDPKKMLAPVCLCKGSKRKGTAILDSARKHGIPVIENPFLAQTLFRTSESGAYVTPGLYHALAAILATQIKK